MRPDLISAFTSRVLRWPSGRKEKTGSPCCSGPPNLWWTAERRILDDIRMKVRRTGGCAQTGAQRDRKKRTESSKSRSRAAQSNERKMMTTSLKADVKFEPNARLTFDK